MAAEDGRARGKRAVPGSVAAKNAAGMDYRPGSVTDEGTLANLESELCQGCTDALTAVHRLDGPHAVQHARGPGRGLHLVAGREIGHFSVINGAIAALRRVVVA